MALTCTVDVMDLLGIYLCLTKFTSRSEQSTGIIKVLSTVVGEFDEGVQVPTIMIKQ